MECILISDSDDEILGAIDLNEPVPKKPRFCFKRPILCHLPSFMPSAELTSGCSTSLDTKLLNILNNTFKITNFRGRQLDIIKAAVNGDHCFVVMPTGFGKSLCFQIPAILSKGVTIIISPLKSLMHDQLTKLHGLKINAKVLSGDVSPHELREICLDLNSRHPEIKILYVTPEMLVSNTALKRALGTLNERNLLSRFVFDEAHCISDWGHDFRPCYRKLQWLTTSYPRVPMMALTATASKEIIGDVQRVLGLSAPKLFFSSAHRANLKYCVLNKTKNCVTDLINSITDHFYGSSGIVYCGSKQECEDVSKKLSDNRISSAPYHAGLSDNIKVSASHDFMSGQIKVIVATVAFGMGIDKSDVRFVIHHTMPTSIKSYFQQTGGAGRDGKFAECHLYYRFFDSVNITAMLQAGPPKNSLLFHFNKSKPTDGTRFKSMLQYCEEKVTCRRVFLIKYFNDDDHSDVACSELEETKCDNCESKDQFCPIDLKQEVLAVLSLLENLTKSNKSVTMPYLTDVLRGSKTQKLISAGHDKLSQHGCLKDWSKSNVDRLLRTLVAHDILDLRLTKNYLNFNNGTLVLGKKAPSSGINSYKFDFAIEVPRTKGKKTEPIECQGNVVEDNCLKELKEVTHNMEWALGRHEIFSDQVLYNISRVLPEDEWQLRQVQGMTIQKCASFGQAILDITVKAAKIRNEILNRNE